MFIMFIYGNITIVASMIYKLHSFENSYRYLQRKLFEFFIYQVNVKVSYITFKVSPKNEFNEANVLNSGRTMSRLLKKI